MSTFQKAELFVSNNGYGTYSNTACNDACRKKRRRKEKTTPQKMAEYNRQYSIKVCEDIINCNFEPDDWHIVLTFSPAMPDYDRLHQGGNAIRRLRELYKRRGKEIKYIVTWGRGEEVGNLHMHFALNKTYGISQYDVLQTICGNIRYGITVEFCDIHSEPVYTVEQRTEALDEFAHYLCKNYDELNEEDVKVIKRRWYASHSIEHNNGTATIIESDEYDRPIGGDPVKQNTELIKAYRNGKLDDRRFNQIIGNKRTIYHIVSGSIKLQKDVFGNENIYLKFIKLGSRIDKRYNPDRYHKKEYVSFYQPRICCGIDFGLFRCNWKRILI